MALTAAFLSTCRTAIDSLPELTAYNTAYAAYGAASRSTRRGLWAAVFKDSTSGPSPAYNLRRAIRDTVNAQADSNGTLGPLDRESAYRTLVAEYVVTRPQPISDAAEAALYNRLIQEDLLS